MSNALPEKTSIKPNQVFVRGKIDDRRRYEKLHYTRVITPAPDAYSRPQVVEIRSKSSLGSVGDELTVHCNLGGYTRKAYRAVDKETGESSSIVPVDMILEAIE